MISLQSPLDSNEVSMGQLAGSVGRMCDLISELWVWAHIGCGDYLKIESLKEKEMSTKLHGTLVFMNLMCMD